jgi:hypothetical protein
MDIKELDGLVIDIVGANLRMEELLGISSFL